MGLFIQDVSNRHTYPSQDPSFDPVPVTDDASGGNQTPGGQQYQYPLVLVPPLDQTTQKTEPSYSFEQATADAKKLFDATEGGWFGWGTDEDLIWHTLEGRSSSEIDQIREAFRTNYGEGKDRDNVHYLDDVLRDETSSFDLQHVNALLKGKENKAETDAVVIQAEIEGDGDEQTVLNTLQNVSAPERHDIAQAYANKYGPLKDGQTPEQFLLAKLGEQKYAGRTQSAAFLDSDELARAKALLDPANGDVAAGNAEADARKIHVGLDGWYKDWGPFGGHFCRSRHAQSGVRRKVRG